MRLGGGLERRRGERRQNGEVGKRTSCNWSHKKKSTHTQMQKK